MKETDKIIFPQAETGKTKYLIHEAFSLEEGAREEIARFTTSVFFKNKGLSQHEISILEQIEKHPQYFKTVLGGVAKFQKLPGARFPRKLKKKYKQIQQKLRLGKFFK